MSQGSPQSFATVLADTGLDIVLAANFSVECIRESLEFWLQKFAGRGTISFAPFNQIFQQLLDAASPLRTSSCPVGLVQMERWWPAPGGRGRDALFHNCEKFGRLLKTAASASDKSFVVLLCPPSPHLRGSDALVEAELALRCGLEQTANVSVVSSVDIEECYPIEDYLSYFDSYADRLAHIPYSRLGFATLGTMIFRRIYTSHAPVRKVIVIDCDDTLWSGTCGENDAEGIELTIGRRHLQQFLVEQVESGKLVCLCSKNEESDVWAVFQTHPEMPLKREHLSAWKINWKPKSDNVVDLSLILDLSLNSFVFIDNDPRECLEIERRCPEVLVLCPPADDGKMKQFLRNVWDFDRRPLTRDDQKRTLYYRQNADRAQERKHWTSLEGFLQSLELRVDISRLVQDDIRRVQQLMERTTQFNLNGIRYSLAELEGAMRSSERLSFVVRATDRFGDYGTIGLIICRLAQASLVIESLLLSCRALGKGVEDRVFSALAEMAENLGATRLDLAYRPTNRNITLRSFLEKKGACKIGEYWTLYPESPDRTNAPNPKSLG